MSIELEWLLGPDPATPVVQLPAELRPQRREFISSAGFPVFDSKTECAPVLPGSFSVIHKDPSDVLTVIVNDDGDGNLVLDPEWFTLTGGTASGTIDYRTGQISLSWLPETTGTLGYRYKPSEGGCPEKCGACKTHKVRITVVPGDEINRNQGELSDAFRRFNRKIADVTPIHVERVFLLEQEEWTVAVSALYDIVPADETQTDTDGLRVLFEDA